MMSVTKRAFRAHSVQMPRVSRSDFQNVRLLGAPGPKTYPDRLCQSVFIKPEFMRSVPARCAPQPPEPVERTTENYPMYVPGSRASGFQRCQVVADFLVEHVGVAGNQAISL